MGFDLPALPDGWQYISLEALSQEKSITYGVVQPGTAVSDGIPIIRVNNFKDGRLDLSDVMHIAPEVESKYGRTRLAGGEVLLTIVGSVGQVAVVPRSLNGFNVARAVAVIHPLKDVSANWIAICLRSPLAQHLLGSRANTTVQTTINLKDLRALPVPIPPVAIRQAIEDLIYSLDDRIALLRETNATLEAMAQALFKSWFVDFDPVHANAGTRAATLPAELQALFPSTFTDNPQGRVPEGWTWQALDDAYELNPKRNLKKGTLANYLDMASVGTSGHTTENPTNREFGSGTKFVNGDTLLARITPCLENGKTAFVDFLEDGETGWGSTEFIVLKPKAPLPPYHAYLLARFPGFREYAIQSMSGTSGRQRVQNDVLGRYMLAVPDDAVAEAFGQLVEVMQQKIQANHQQAQTLATLRDTLLPRLISGQLRLPDAAAALVEAGA